MRTVRGLRGELDRIIRVLGLGRVSCERLLVIMGLGERRTRVLVYEEGFMSAVCRSIVVVGIAGVVGGNVGGSYLRGKWVGGREEGRRVAE